MRRVFFGLALISLMTCSAFAGDVPNVDSDGSQKVRKPSPVAEIRGPKNNKRVSKTRPDERPGSRSLSRRQLMRLSIRPACRFHQPPNRRLPRPIHGPVFTSEWEPARLSHKTEQSTPRWKATPICRRAWNRESIRSGEARFNRCCCDRFSNLAQIGTQPRTLRLPILPNRCFGQPLVSLRFGNAAADVNCCSLEPVLN